MDGVQLQSMKGKSGNGNDANSNGSGHDGNGVVLERTISTPADPHVPPPFAHEGAQFVPVQPVYYDGPAGNGHGTLHPPVTSETTLTFTPISQ
jgi:hypothetical protein